MLEIRICTLPPAEMWRETGFCSCSFLNKTVGFLCLDSRSLIFTWRSEGGGNSEVVTSASFSLCCSCQHIRLGVTAAIPHGAAAGAAWGGLWWEGDGSGRDGIPMVCWSWELTLGTPCKASSRAGLSSVNGGVTALLLWQLLELGRECTRHPGLVTRVLPNCRARTAELFQHWEMLQAH